MVIKTLPVGMSSYNDADRIRGCLSNHQRFAGILWMLKRIASSTLAWILIMLCVIDMLMVNVHPFRYLRYEGANGFVPFDLNPDVSKFPKFLSSKGSPDIILLGSSLVREAIAKYDKEFGSTVRDYQGFFDLTYPDAHYISAMLNKKFGRTVSVANLSTSACMASDAYLILQTAINANKIPKVVIYGIAPRDFIDNTVPPVGATPVGLVLSTDWVSTIRLCSTNFIPQNQKYDLLIARAWHYYAVRADYHELITEYLATWLNRPIGLQSTVEQINMNKEQSAHNIKCQGRETSHHSNRTSSSFIQEAANNDYIERYAPLNQERWKQEINYFNMLVQLCKAKHIRLFVFNMPRTRQNQLHLSKPFYEMYLDTVCGVCQESGATFRNLNNGNFFMSDFSDTVHVNVIGSKKVQDQFIETLSQ